MGCSYELELEVIERLRMPDLSPQTADMQTRRIVRDIMDEVLIGAEEAEKIELETRVFYGGKKMHKWNKDKESAKKIVLNNVEMQFLKDRVTELDDNKQITDEMFDLCIKIKDCGKVKVKEKRKRK